MGNEILLLIATLSCIYTTLSFILFSIHSINIFNDKNNILLFKDIPIWISVVINSDSNISIIYIYR